MKKEYVLDADGMKRADEGTIEVLGIGQDVLMERAALAVAACVKKYQPVNVLCVCGNGNNGGDAVATARILCMQGINADVYMCGDSKKYKSSVVKQLDIFRKIGGRTVNDPLFSEYDIIVDGIFGIGMERRVEGDYAKVIDVVNEAKAAGIKVISIDIPSGIHTDTGAVLSSAVKADETVSFAYYKPGHLLYPGALYCGKVTVEEIGISHRYFYGEELNYFTVSPEEEIKLPERRRDGNKGTFGRVLVIAGSESMYGACYLSALAVLRMGAGLVDIYTNEINRVTLQNMIPEAIVHTYTNEGINKEVLCKLIDSSTCVVIGPGISVDDNAMELVSTVMEYCDKTIIADADALNCIANQKDLLYNQKRFANREMIITPHPGEFSRLTGQSVTGLKENYVKSVMDFAKEYGVIVVGKDAGTVVSDGKNVYFNQTGNDGMATAGSGDVLSGIIGSLCAQGLNAYEAAWKGVFIHGKAGDTAIKDTNTHSLIARDIANTLTKVIN